MKPFAVLREVPESLERCLLTHKERQPIDIKLAREQHENYRKVLEENGFDTQVLEADEYFPDCVFIEDVALTLVPMVKCNPLRAERASEITNIYNELGEFSDLEIKTIPPLLSLEGGDVLKIGETLFVGNSSRTSLEAIQWLDANTDLEVIPVKVNNVLHLKTGLTALDDKTVLAAFGAVDEEPFREKGIRFIYTSNGEEYGACVIRLPNGKILMGEGYPHTLDFLRFLKYDVVTVDLGEFAKAEGSPTCLSLRFNSVYD